MADNNLDPESFNRLTDALNELNKTMGQSAGSPYKAQSAAELREAVVKAKIEKTNKERDLEIARLKRSTDAGDKELLNRKLQDKKTEELTKKYQEQSDTLVKLDKAKQKEFNAVEKQLSRQKEIEDAGAKLNDSLKDLAKTTSKTLGKQLFSSSNDQGKFGDTVKALGSGLMNITSKLGWVGKGLGLFGGIILQLVGDALKHNSALNDAYENLSQFGLVDVTGIKGMFDNLQNAGMTVEELGKFSSILTSVSPALATMGTTAAEGAKKVADSFAAIRGGEAERGLRNLGYTSETMVKTFAEYQGMMGKLNLIQGKSTAQVSKESTKYAETLDQLSKLTGESRDAIQKKMDADAMDLAFRLKMQRMLGSTSEAEQKIGREMQAAAEMSHGMGEDMAEGVRDMIASGGGAVTDASVKLQQSTGGAATSIIQQLNAGQISGIEANRQIAEAQHKQLTSISQGSMLFNENLTALGHSAKQEEFYAKIRGKSNEEVARIIKEQQIQEKAELDSQRSANTQGVMTNRNLQQVKDKLNQLIGVNVAGVFELFMKMVNGVAKRLAELLKKIGGPDFTSAFDSSDDIKDQINKTAKELDDVNTKLANANNAKSIYDRDELAYKDNLKKQRDLELALSKETNKDKKTDLEKELRITRAESIALKAKEFNSRLILSHADKEKKALEEQKKLLEQQLLNDKNRFKAKQGEIFGGTQQEDVTAGQISEKTDVASGKLLDFIGKAEGAGYNTKFGGEVTDLTSKSINEIIAVQKQMVAEGKGSSAVGKYQFINSTLERLVDKLKIGKDEKFNPEMQDKLARELIKESGSDKVKEGKMSQKQFADNLAGVWASLPKESGKSVYHGDSMGNKATVTRKQLEEAISTQPVSTQTADAPKTKTADAPETKTQIPGAKLGGMLSGPASGYPVMLHGNEMVIPLPDATGISQVASQSLDNQTKNTFSSSQQSSTSADAVLALLAEKLDSVIDYLRKSNDTQENILTYTKA